MREIVVLKIILIMMIITIIIIIIIMIIIICIITKMKIIRIPLDSPTHTHIISIGNKLVCVF